MKKLKKKRKRDLQNVTLVSIDKPTEVVKILQHTNCNNKKKCQPSTRDRPDLIKTEPVPRRGLTRPQIKTNKMRKSKNEIIFKLYKKKIKKKVSALHWGAGTPTNKK